MNQAKQSRAWFSGRTSASQAESVGSIPIARFVLKPPKIKVLGGFLFGFRYLIFPVFPSFPPLNGGKNGGKK